MRGNVSWLIDEKLANRLIWAYSVLCRAGQCADFKSMVRFQWTQGWSLASGVYRIWLSYIAWTPRLGADVSSGLGQGF